MKTNTNSMNGQPHGRDEPRQKQFSDKLISSPKQSNWFTLPQPIRHLFDSFPIRILPKNNSPQRAATSRNQHVLYVFARTEDEVNPQLSYNPACLKWQAYLSSKDIQFTTKASNNHASPSGSLPFLIPRLTSTNQQTLPVTSNKLQRWCLTQAGISDHAEDTSTEVYQALIDQDIRNAWLYQLYLDKSNFVAVATPLYIMSSSSNALVQTILASQLRAAAHTEVLKSHAIIDADDILDAADKAFRSLSAILGKSNYFAGDARPELFDASLFAYTHLILDTGLGWSNLSLQHILMRYPNLLDHRSRMLTFCEKS